MKFNGYLLVSDMDNTLLNSEHQVSYENKKAIEYFTKNGGYFTVATGRTAVAAGEYVENIILNAPAILNNGAQIFNYKTKEVLFEKFIADERKQAIKIMHEKYPFLGFEIYSNENAYVYAECSETERLKKRGYPTVHGVNDEIWSSKWTKVLMIGDKDVLDKYEPIYRQYDNGYAVRSGDKFFDIVADGVSKGNALLTLAKIIGIDKNKTVAAGDNMNDIDLLKTAGISYAVENAEQQVKKIADAVAPSCDDNAIAWIVEQIEKNK